MRWQLQQKGGHCNPTEAIMWNTQFSSAQIRKSQPVCMWIWSFLQLSFAVWHKRKSSCYLSYISVTFKMKISKDTISLQFVLMKMKLGHQQMFFNNKKTNPVIFLPYLISLFVVVFFFFRKCVTVFQMWTIMCIFTFKYITALYG